MEASRAASRSCMLADRCAQCGQRMGLVAGLRGFGIRARGHQARCLQRLRQRQRSPPRVENALVEEPAQQLSASGVQNDDVQNTTATPASCEGGTGCIQEVAAVRPSFAGSTGASDHWVTAASSMASQQDAAAQARTSAARKALTAVKPFMADAATSTAHDKLAVNEPNGSAANKASAIAAALNGETGSTQADDTSIVGGSDTSKNTGVLVSDCGDVFCWRSKSRITLSSGEADGRLEASLRSVQVARLDELASAARADGASQVIHADDSNILVSRMSMGASINSCAQQEPHAEIRDSDFGISDRQLAAVASEDQAAEPEDFSIDLLVEPRSSSNSRMRQKMAERKRLLESMSA